MKRALVKDTTKTVGQGGLLVLVYETQAELQKMIAENIGDKYRILSLNYGGI
jgi:hypothetical protein